MPTAKQVQARQVRQAARRQHILQSAMSCFARHGVQATSMQDIFAQGGLSPSVVYRHFRSKQAIIVAAAEHSTQALKVLLLPRDPIGLPMEITDFTHEILQRLNQRAAQPTLRNVLALLAEAVGNPAVRVRFLVMRRAVLEALAKALPRAAPDEDARQLLYTLLLGAVVQKAMDPELDVSPLAKSWKSQVVEAKTTAPVAAVAQGWIQPAPTI